MKWTPLIAIAFGSILLGCGESREEDREVAPPAVAEEDSTAVADSLTMPDLPEARRGFLVARGLADRSEDVRKVMSELVPVLGCGQLPRVWAT